jgi:D-erythro-7,8-dihydroneopterin triphosphate epimerase
MMSNEEHIPATLFIKNLTVSCIIGVNRDEREHEQEIRMQLFLWTDIAKSSRSDNLEDALDYSTIYKEVVKRVEHSKFYLIERLAFEVATICLQHPLTLKVQVVLEKMGALENAESSGIELVLEK